MDAVGKGPAWHDVNQLVLGMKDVVFLGLWHGRRLRAQRGILATLGVIFLDQPHGTAGLAAAIGDWPAVSGAHDAAIGPAAGCKQLQVAISCGLGRLRYQIGE